MLSGPSMLRSGFCICSDGALCMEESSKELSGILTKEGDVFKAEREGVCDMCEECEECDGVQK